MDKVFNYNGAEITFSKGESTIVNANHMAKVFGKAPKDWLKTEYAKQYADMYAKGRNVPLADLVIVRKGGSNPGTWLHEDIALEFARWLSPEFAIWCNDRVKELLQTGVATVNDEDSTIAAAMDILNSRLQRQQQALKEATPKVEYHDKVLTSTSTYTTTQIAKELALSAVALNRKLNKLKVQYNQNNTWLLYAHHVGKDYTKTKTYTYTDADGQTKTSMQTVWTEKGRRFVHELFKGQHASI